MRVTIDMIPYGFNNRITRETLISITSQSDRAVRHQLSELAAKHPLCLSSHWKGVFRPLPKLYKFMRQLGKKAMTADAVFTKARKEGLIC